MIRALTGTLTTLDPITRAALIRVESAGLEYEVLLPAYFAEALAASPPAAPITLRTHHTLETASQGASYVPRLIGFPTEADRRFFELFTTVKGLGARRALRAMIHRPGEIAAAIARKDSAALKRLPEIGARLAETIIAELSGKVDAFATAEAAGDAPGVMELKAARGASARNGPTGDAIATLIALGDTAPDAERRVDRALARLGGGDRTADEIVHAALGG